VGLRPLSSRRRRGYNRCRLSTIGRRQCIGRQAACQRAVETTSGGTAMAGRLEGKCALVTGGRRGIGRGCALELAREGASVAINDVEGREQAEAVAEEVRRLGGKAAVVIGDVSKAADVERFVEAA